MGTTPPTGGKMIDTKLDSCYNLCSMVMVILHMPISQIQKAEGG